MATSVSGGLFTWESCPSTSSCTSLGRGCATPERVPWFTPPEKVFRVACGTRHALVLTSCGVYSWGSNIYGQLGLGIHCSPVDPQTVEPAPVCLPVDCKPVLDVACGDFHSVVLSAAGQVFTFGCNWEGQLGINESQYSENIVATGCAYEPLPVIFPGPEADMRIYFIVAGPQTTVVAATTGQVFQWGKCVRSGIDGVCGQINCLQPEDLKTVRDSDAPVSGPIWHSIAFADGLVVLTRHTNSTNSAVEDPVAR
ncbi:putative E3 ubiquitin-protein ligase HERC4-like isoform X1 [Phytophthora megakarya]|uniref:Putative E3 ubiquitin-protein ligase HERC4-like isoform X1 n=1 Tax=Phytophthora megakarya TaxID=4795 RepID=A0A225UK60_9STRA|nr:putative E3 ubiquitin-protein ligase HERC4-like isoform X1 [Phytophthora megakarya]